MRKFIKGLSIALTMTLAMGLFTGCGNKTMNATYDYVASDYIELGQYKGIEVDVDDFTVTEDDLQNVIDQILEKYTEYELVDRAAKDGDMVLVSFNAYISGGKVEGFSGQDHELIIGSDEFIIDGFEEALIGLKAGDDRAITGLKVPEDFSTQEKYAGKSITFDVYIDTVYEPIIPEYSDEFVSTLTGGEFTTVESYNEDLMKTLEENAVTNKYNDKYDKAMEKLINSTTVIKDFPAEYVESKMGIIQEELNMFLPLTGETESEYLMQHYGAETVEEAANGQILLEFIFQQIFVEENITITEKYYKENLLDTAKSRNYSTAERFVEKLTENGVVKCMLVDKAVDLILESVVEK